MSNETENVYSSDKRKFAPYSMIIDDRVRNTRPEDDVEYAIAVIINSGIKLLSRYRSLRRHKQFKAKICCFKDEEIKVETLKIRDRTSNFRAKVKILVEQTNTN
jgi:hypothetical protein